MAVNTQARLAGMVRSNVRSNRGVMKKHTEGNAGSATTRHRNEKSRGRVPLAAQGSQSLTLGIHGSPLRGYRVVAPKGRPSIARGEALRTPGSGGEPLDRVLEPLVRAANPW